MLRAVLFFNKEAFAGGGMSCATRTYVHTPFMYAPPCLARLGCTFSRCASLYLRLGEYILLYDFDLRGSFFASVVTREAVREVVF